MGKNNDNSFSDNYLKLKKISDELNKTIDLDIDKLVPMIKEAKKSYDNCKDKLSDVYKALEEHMPKKSIDE